MTTETQAHTCNAPDDDLCNAYDDREAQIRHALEALGDLVMFDAHAPRVMSEPDREHLADGIARVQEILEVRLMVAIDCVIDADNDVADAEETARDSRISQFIEAARSDE